MDFLNESNIVMKYKEQGLLWGMKPNPYVVKIPEIISSGNTLDIGVGEGRNAIFLAKRGFEVTGIDCFAHILTSAHIFLDCSQIG